MANYKLTGTKESILDSFGYIVLDKGEYWVALIKDDPEAFLVVCESEQEAIDEAFNFLQDEAVDYEFIIKK